MPKILLVEDDSNLREIYGARLEAEGYEIVSASDGEEALAIAVREHPQLIISDVMMPRISGFDMLDILRSTPETKDVKVIVMTALSQEADRQRGEALGADRYVVKSQVTLDDVVSMVQELLATTTPTSQPDSPPASPQSAPNPPPATADDNAMPPATPAISNPSVTPIQVTADPSPALTVPDQPITDPASPAVDPASAPAAPSTADDNLTPTDEAELAKEVEQFVATSPLMNGSPPPTSQAPASSDSTPLNEPSATNSSSQPG